MHLFSRGLKELSTSVGAIADAGLSEAPSKANSNSQRDADSKGSSRGERSKAPGGKAPPVNKPNSKAASKAPPSAKQSASGFDDGWAPSSSTSSGWAPNKKEQQFVRLPVTSAKRLKFYDKSDLNALIKQHLHEKQQVLEENTALRQLIMDQCNLSEVEVDNALGETVTDIRRTNDDINRVLLLSTQAEIATLKETVESQSKEIASYKLQIAAFASGARGVPQQLQASDADFQTDAALVETLQDVLDDLAPEDLAPYHLPPATLWGADISLLPGTATGMIWMMGCGCPCGTLLTGTASLRASGIRLRLALFMSSALGLFHLPGDW
ncbi:hypothetical protein CYMTET_25890 [Cymbomonas tetramitiformis]|uniref:Uncharacterized protein n=1 Tax=Cymbomonas tetramitiformis TaxID=36881 RepID=A0AAE0FSV7_9CHLO|nr:hypothetical protein CYMTET_25890 [Cymbomonas tetramitiformis]